MGEEEKASALSLALSRLEHLIIVEHRRKWILYLLIIDAIELPELLEYTECEIRNPYFLVYDLLFIVIVRLGLLIGFVAFSDEFVVFRNVPLSCVVYSYFV